MASMFVASFLVLPAKANGVFGLVMASTSSPGRVLIVSTSCTSRVGVGGVYVEGVRGEIATSQRNFACEVALCANFLYFTFNCSAKVKTGSEDSKYQSALRGQSRNDAISYSSTQALILDLPASHPGY